MDNIDREERIFVVHPDQISLKVVHRQMLETKASFQTSSVNLEA